MADPSHSHSHSTPQNGASSPSITPNGLPPSADRRALRKDKSLPASPLKKSGVGRRGLSTMRAMQRIKSVRKGSSPVGLGLSRKRTQTPLQDELTQAEDGGGKPASGSKSKPPLARALSSRLSRKNVSENLAIGGLLKGRGAEEILQGLSGGELVAQAQAQVASAGESAILAFKMRRSGEGRPQVLAVSKSETNLFVYRLGFRVDKAQGFAMMARSRFSLKCLVRIDGRASAGCELALTFRDDKRGELRTYTYTAARVQEKMAVLWCLIQLCLQYLHFLPQTANLIRAELGLFAAQHNFEALCPLLSTHPAAAELAAETPIAPQPPTGNLITLTAVEEDELREVLSAEGLDGLDSGDLLPALQGRIREMEAETAAEMLSWEQRGDAGGLNDPVEAVVLKLEGVEAELSALDAWMSNYNEELKTMRKGIQKIEQENNRLQIKSRNQRRLKETLASMLQRYNVDRDTQNVLDNVANILFVECLGQVEDANPSVLPNHEENALKRILQAAEKLSQASLGQAVSEPGIDPTDLPRVEHEEALRAVKERVQEINDACERFVYNVNCFMLERFKTIASQAANVQPSDKNTGFPTLQDAAKLAHRKLLPYRVLVRTTQILKHTLSEDYYDKMLVAYRGEISTLYRGVFKGFFQQLAQATAKGNTFDSRLSSMRPATIGNHVEEKRRAVDLVRQAASDSREKHTSSFALRYCLKQIAQVVLAEQSFIARMFFTTSPNGVPNGRDTDRGLNETQQRLCDDVLKVIFLEECHSLELLDEYIVQPVRGGINNYEMMSMVVNVDAEVVRLEGSSSFLVNMLTDSSKGLQGALQASFSGFIDEQLRWIEGLRPDTRYAGILEPFLKFPQFVDTILAVWEVCSIRNEAQSNNAVQDEMARNSVRMSLQQIAATLFTWLEKVSATKAKYTLITKIENFYFFHRTMQERGVQELGKWERLASARFEGALSDYVSKACESQFTDLVNFVDAVDVLLESLKASDVVYHKPKDELAVVLKKLSNVKPDIAEMRARVNKHFRDISTVKPIVAERIVATTRALFEHFEHIVKTCYSAQLQPSASQVNAWLRAEFNTIMGQSTS